MTQLMQGTTTDQHYVIRYRSGDLVFIPRSVPVIVEINITDDGSKDVLLIINGAMYELSELTVIGLDQLVQDITGSSIKELYEQITTGEIYGTSKTVVRNQIDGTHRRTGTDLDGTATTV